MFLFYFIHLLCREMCLFSSLVSNWLLKAACFFLFFIEKESFINKSFKKKKKKKSCVYSVRYVIWALGKNKTNCGGKITNIWKPIHWFRDKCQLFLKENSVLFYWIRIVTSFVCCYEKWLWFLKKKKKKKVILKKKKKRVAQNFCSYPRPPNWFIKNSWSRESVKKISRFIRLPHETKLWRKVEFNVGGGSNVRVWVETKTV